MPLTTLALIGRIILIGTEKIFVKYLSKYDTGAVTFWWFFSAFLLYLPIVAVMGVDDWSFLKYSPLVSFFYATAFILYTEAMKKEEVSLLAPIYNFNIIFLLILAVIFLGESITIFKVIGLLLLLFGGSFLTQGKNFIDSYKKLFTNRGAMLMLGCSLLIAVGRIFDGFFVQEVEPIVYALGLEFFITIYLLIYVLARKKIKEIPRMIKESPWLTLGLSVTNAASYLFLLIAFTQIEVSIAEPLTMLGAIISIILAKFLFGDKIKERMIGAVVMAIGAWLLFM